MSCAAGRRRASRAASAVIYVKDRDGRYLLINRRFEAIFELQRRDVLGRTDHEIFPDASQAADAFRQNDAFVLETQRPTEFEEVAPHTDGLHTYISLKFPLLNPEGEPYATCGISTDITDRKRASEALRRAKEEAEAANRAKTVFLANVSHELKTPIMAMMGSAELLCGDRREDPSHDRGDVIIRNARHLLEMVDRMLDLSRIESARMETRIGSCSVAELIEDALAANLPLPAERNLELSVLVESDLPRTILTDTTRVRQAIINLVSNALKFTQKGYVRVHVRVEGEGDNLKLVVDVEDTGPGIAPESLEHIFAPFAQLAPHGGEISQGMGLGLSLAREYARRLGGDVTVQSTLGAGSCFTLSVDTGSANNADWIPMEVARQRFTRRLPQAVIETPPVLRGSVLLAEDYRDTRELIQAALEQAGVKVTAVTDGVEAVRAAQQHQFDLILLDVRMPRLDGAEAARKLRALGNTSAIIALTASHIADEKRRLWDAGFDDVWHKPIRLQVLLREISAYLATAPEGPGTERHSAPQRTGTSADDFDARIAAANADYARSLPNKVERLQELVRTGDLAQARELLHQLAGSGGIHGFMTISDEAAKLLPFIADPEDFEPPDLTRLAREAVAIAEQHSVVVGSEPTIGRPTDFD